MFNTKFGGSSQITNSNKDIIGVDDDSGVDPPNDWDLNLPNYTAHIGEWSFGYELNGTQSPNDMIAELVPFPTDTNNQVLRFTILHGSGYPTLGQTGETGRVQSQIHHNTSHSFGGADYQAALKNINYTTDLFIPEDFEWMLKTGQSQLYNFMTLCEFFNSKSISSFSNGEDFRIGLELYKKAGEDQFRLAIQGDSRENNDWASDSLGSWEFISDGTASAGNIVNDITIGATEDTISADFILNQWMTFDVTLIEGDEDHGKFILKITQGGVTKTVFDLTINTHHLGDNLLDGFHFIQPQKLYTRGRVIEWPTDSIGGFNDNKYVKEANPNDSIQAVCHVYYDNFSLNAITPSSQSDCANIVANDFDVEQRDDGSMILNADSGNEALDIGEKWVGLQFFGYSIPRGAEITSASLRFVARASDASSTPFRVTIAGQNPLDADPFVDDTFHLRDRPVILSSSMEWSSLPDWTQDETYEVDIDPVIKGILDAHGSNDIGPEDVFSIIITSKLDTFTVQRRAKSFDDEPGEAPQLCITYKTSISGAFVTSCGTPASHLTNIGLDIVPTGNDPCAKGNYDTTAPYKYGVYETEICGAQAEYQITPYKTTAPFCGFTMSDYWDIYYIRYNLASYTDLQRVAADVVQNDVIDGDDLGTIYTMVLNDSTLAKPWTFVADSLPSTSNPNVPLYDENNVGDFPSGVKVADFEPVRMGDIDCTCAPPVWPPPGGGGTESFSVFILEEIRLEVDDVSTTKFQTFVIYKLR